jgi:hypothetical protein
MNYERYSKLPTLAELGVEIEDKYDDSENEVYALMMISVFFSSSFFLSFCLLLLLSFLTMSWRLGQHGRRGTFYQNLSISLKMIT